jgi:hypothetical protein
MSGTGKDGGTPVSGVLAMVFAMISVTLSLWAAFIVAMLGGDNAVVLLHAEDYRPATFTIERLVYKPGGSTAGSIRGTTTRRSDRYWAEGRIGEQAEKFTLGGYLKGIPKDQEEFEGWFSVGQQLSVLYDPDVPRSLNVRVLHPRENFAEFWRQRWRNIFLVAYLPMGIALALCAVCSLLATSWSWLKFALFSVPIALTGWIPALITVLRS